MTITARFRICHPGFTLDAELAVPGSGVTILSGNSGSGKTSILRAVAGLDRHADGYLEVNGELWQDSASGVFVPAHQRAIGYVFQEASLFAHLTVAGNLGFVRKRVKAGGIDLAHAVALLGIDPLMQRRTGQLSGGERQRVAIARALLSNPRLLLLDEPLASLDRQRKDDVLPYLERVHAELDIPMLYVSHAADEVARLADYIVFLDAGKVRMSGPADQVLGRLDLAMTMTEEAGVVVRGVVEAVDEEYGLLGLQVAGQRFWVAHEPLAAGTGLRLRIMARDVSLALTRPSDSSILNHLQGTVLAQSASANRAHVLVSVDIGGTTLQARITRHSRDALGICEGKQLWVQVKAVALLSLPA
jgi:molybdate transport system ATP-binding protein